MARISNATARKLGLTGKPKANSYPIVEMCKAMGLLAPESEHRFAPPRKWRFDFAWVNAKIALEIDGGTWTKSRHHHGTGLIKDREKLNAAAIAGWRVIRCGPEDVESGAVYELIRQAIGKL